jgi:hypothetical protein
MHVRYVLLLTGCGGLVMYFVDIEGSKDPCGLLCPNTQKRKYANANRKQIKENQRIACNEFFTI